VSGWRIASDPLTSRSARITADHVGRHARLVEKDQAAGRQKRLSDAPLGACFDDVRPQLLGRVNAFF
jgi:hypothetical protein